MCTKPEKVPMVALTARGAAVGATKLNRKLLIIYCLCSGLISSLPGALIHSANAATLPEERADLGFNYYSGDGLRVTGPVLLVRKNILDQYSISANYKEDNISGASVDVRSQASAYSETREEISLGGQTIIEDSIISLNTSFSEEPDYESTSIGFAIAHDFFADLFTLNLGFNRGWDTVGQVDTNLDEDIHRYNFNLGISSVFSKRWLLSLDYEINMEEGRLDNPYRGAIIQGAHVLENYPGTRTGHAFSVSALNYRRPDTARRFYYRYFNDTWSVSSNTFEFSYATPFKQIGPELVIEYHVRFYLQNSASFYFDNAPAASKYIARDKELSDFNTVELGAVGHYDLSKWVKIYFNEVTASFGYTGIFFEYQNFTDLSKDRMLNFRADLVQAYITAKF